MIDIPWRYNRGDSTGILVSLAPLLHLPTLKLWSGSVVLSYDGLLLIANVTSSWLQQTLLIPAGSYEL